MKRTALLGLASIALMLMSGCSNEPAPVSVSGVATFNGLPLKEVNVAFWQAQGGGPASSPTDQQGRYGLKLRPGDYRVTISKIVGAMDATPPDEEVPEATVDPELEEASAREHSAKNDDDTTVRGQELIPPRYSDYNQTELTITVPSGGANQADLAILIGQ